jgi:hypothetical protein
MILFLLAAAMTTAMLVSTAVILHNESASTNELRKPIF